MKSNIIANNIKIHSESSSLIVRLQTSKSLEAYVCNISEYTTSHTSTICLTYTTVAAAAAAAHMHGTRVHAPRRATACMNRRVCTHLDTLSTRKCSTCAEFNVFYTCKSAVYASTRRRFWAARCCSSRRCRACCSATSTAMAKSVNYIHGAPQCAK